MGARLCHYSLCLFCQLELAPAVPVGSDEDALLDKGFSLALVEVVGGLFTFLYLEEFLSVEIDGVALAQVFE